MSKRALELLIDLDLIDRDGQVADLATFSDSELRGKLETYVRVRTEALDNEVRRAASTAGKFSALVSSISASNAVLPLLPSTLVYDRITTDDPVFPLGVAQSEHGQAASRLFGLGRGEAVDRPRIANKLYYFAALAPLIRSGAVCVLPISHIHRAPDQLPIFFSEDGFASEVPEHIRDFVSESARVREVMIDRDTGSMYIRDEPPAKPTRTISIAFDEDDPVSSSMTYFLSQMRKVGESQGSMIRMEQTFDPDDEPEAATYERWVAQSINKTVLNRLRSVASELALAEGLGAAYMTESPFESKLFSLSTDKTLPVTSREAAVNFLRAATPFLTIDSPELIARIRGDNQVLFEKFHAGMLQIASQLTGVESDFEDKARQLYVKEVEPQVQAINTQLSKTRAQVGAGIASAAAATVLALLKLPTLPFVTELTIMAGAGALTALGSALPNVGEYIGKRRTPAFIWSQLAKE